MDNIIPFTNLPKPNRLAGPYRNIVNCDDTNTFCSNCWINPLVGESFPWDVNNPSCYSKCAIILLWAQHYEEEFIHELRKKIQTTEQIQGN